MEAVDVIHFGENRLSSHKPKGMDSSRTVPLRRCSEASLNTGRGVRVGAPGSRMRWQEEGPRNASMTSISPHMDRLIQGFVDKG